MKKVNNDLVQVSKKFVAEELQKKFGDIWNEICVFIYGSVSYGLADNFSNINLEVILPDNKFSKINSIITKKGGKEIKIDFSRWSKYEEYFSTFPKNCVSSFWTIEKSIVLHDPSGRFQNIKEKVNKYFPEDIWKDKIFEKWFQVSFNGIKKALERNEIITAQIDKGKMIQAVMELVFLLNRQYLPPIKWLHRLFLNLPHLSKEIEPHLNLILEIQDPDEFEKENRLVNEIIGRYLKSNNLLSNEKIEKPWMFV